MAGKKRRDADAAEAGREVPDQIHRFYEIEQHKLLLDFEKIGLFTGHPGTLGSFREARLRQYIRDLTPEALVVGSGFVSTWTKGSGRVVDSQSRQIDCLVHDRRRSVPLLTATDFAIIEPRALYAAVEIKSSFTFHREYAKPGSKPEEYPLGGDNDRYRWTGTLVEAMQNIAALKAVCAASPGSDYATFLGVFAYQLTFDLSTLYAALDNGEIQLQLGITHIDQLPGSICVPGRAMVCFSGWDIFEPAAHHDPYTSFMNEIESAGAHIRLPAAVLLDDVPCTGPVEARGSRSGPGGLFSAVGATARIWSHHSTLSPKATRTRTDASEKMLIGEVVIGSPLVGGGWPPSL